ncbi:hypothetical protein GLAREA_12954 [Glarea lozoyensis ATCC 20868]|uniref:Uncharacterized protein n=1 Tax=Glarea lozoyensis (strain ATCC 20868 / MF5171) TaxID=1116229 RepID=S3DE25_GLAL2|nr:uncharacterized protein GLAREA_12954 [Glarea lozoyensis ATCC 20868]EPE30231.1 hypothetical protein GLAREA_12954 [Glarea lozoyensis ATCC 20868]
MCRAPRQDDRSFGDSLDTHAAANAAGDFTNYGWKLLDVGQIDNAARGQGKNQYASFELNPQTFYETISYGTLLTMLRYCMKVICSNSWEDSTVKYQYALFGSTNFGDNFGNALSRFMKDYGNVKRKDAHLEPACSVGHVIRKSIFSHVTRSIYPPGVNGEERLGFWTSLEVKDEVGPAGGEAAFQASADGQNLGKQVAVSSSDSEGDSRWHPSYLTDGNVDSGLDVRFGWSSVLHLLPTGTEWAQVNFGASQSIGKVVSFSRSGFLEQRGSGFPADHNIQGSVDESY